MIFTLVLSKAQGFTVQDCGGAIPVCSTSYTTTDPNIGSGNVPNEVSTSLSCLGAGEINSVWYTFNIQTSGNLNFTIFPTNPSNDYDWALFNLTGASCSQIATDPSLLVSCNFTGAPGPTGANGGAPPLNNPVVPVQAGETYVLIMSIFSTANQQGYTIDFSSSTAQIFDNIPPVLDSIVTPIKCNSDTMLIFFSENVKCADITPGIFQLNGPGGPYTITDIYAPNCAAGGLFSAQYRLTVSPPITASGSFSLGLVSSVSDLCGNTATAGSTADLTFNIQNIIVDSTYSTLADCNQSNGSAGIDASGGSGTLNYSWNPSGQNTPQANNLPAGDYVVTVTDQNQCTVQETITVQNPINFTVLMSQLPDTCLKGSGIALANVSGTSGPYTYLWNTTDTITDSIATHLTGNQNIFVTITDVDGCVQIHSIPVENEENDSLFAFFIALPDTVDLLFPYSKITNLSANYFVYEWNYLGRIVTDTLNPIINFPTYGTYPVTIKVFDRNGCRKVYTHEIEVISNLYYYIPNSFTANDNGINDVWRPKGIGFDTTSYNIEIFDYWGQRVFYSYNSNAGWNGEHYETKHMCPSGMYAYRIHMRDIYGMEAEFIGNIYLIR